MGAEENTFSGLSSIGKVISCSPVASSDYVLQELKRVGLPDGWTAA
jgi:hypothetical protein